MGVRRLDRKDWQALADRFSRGLIGKRAEIEVASLDLGSQVAAR
jgi:Family of unknown function (DUF5335)